jgi:PAS domain S-box-containing protein
MSVMLLLSICLRLLAMGWSAVLLHRLRDWRMGFMTAMLALMAWRQLLTLSALPPAEHPASPGPVSELPGLAVSLMAFFAVVFLARMIADGRRVADTLRQEKQFAERLLDTARAIVLVLDPRGRIVRFNAFLERLTGHRLEEIRGRDHVEVLVPERERAHVRDWLAAKARDAEGAGGGTRVSPVRGSDGREHMIEWSAAPLRDPHGRHLGTLAIGLDVTERDRLQEAVRESQRMEALGTLATGIAHDFNNVLSAILGNAQLALADTPDGTTARANLQGAIEAGRQAEALVEQILAFASKRPPRQRPVHLAAVVDQALRFLRVTLPPSIQIRRQLDSGDDLVLADPTEVHQVVTNLCTNAVDAMGHGGGVLEVTLAPVVVRDGAPGGLPDLRPGPHVELVVRDTGHGIAPQVRERIFEPFFTTKKAGEGSGIGLAVTYGIVARYGGSITVESPPGGGAVFRVYLPLHAPRVTEAATAGQAAAGVPRGTGRILFVDDDADLVRIALQMLMALGYQAVSAGSGAEALEVVRRAPADFTAVVTDARMPGMSGQALARELRELRPDLPVILCTGAPEPGSAPELEAAGVRHIIRKPLLIERLGHSLRTALDTTACAPTMG